MFQNQHSTIPMKQFRLITLCLTVFLAGLSLSASAQSSSAASTVLLRIEGTKVAMTGEVTQKGREGQHSVLAYSQARRNCTAWVAASNRCRSSTKSRGPVSPLV